jgi:hypothetical protein
MGGNRSTSLQILGDYIKKRVVFPTDDGYSRTPYSVFLMHRRTDLWGPDGEQDNRLTTSLERIYTHNFLYQLKNLTQIGSLMTASGNIVLLTHSFSCLSTQAPGFVLGNRSADCSLKVFILTSTFVLFSSPTTRFLSSSSDFSSSSLQSPWLPMSKLFRLRSGRSVLAARPSKRLSSKAILPSMHM